MISKENVNSYLKDCMRHYPNSLLMQYANGPAQKKMMEFMVKEFLPVWRKAVYQYMEKQGIEQISEDVILEKIHAKIYLEKGFSERENEIFKATDPEGHEKFVQVGINEAMNTGD